MIKKTRVKIRFFNYPYKYTFGTVTNYTIMRTFLTTIFLIPFYCSTYSQTKLVKKVVPVLSPQYFYLNGGLRGALGGRSRLVYKIDLPLNTIEWYYSFTTTKNTNAPSINLVGQLIKLVNPATSIIASAIIVPSGATLADVYLLDEQNKYLFINKSDKKGQPFYYITSASRENYTHGVVMVKNIADQLYLGIRNPSAYDGVYVTLEVAAIVKETN